MGWLEVISIVTMGRVEAAGGRDSGQFRSDFSSYLQTKPDSHEEAGRGPFPRMSCLHLAINSRALERNRSFLAVCDDAAFLHWMVTPT